MTSKATLAFCVFGLIASTTHTSAQNIVSTAIKEISLGSPTSAACKPKLETYTSSTTGEPIYAIQNCTIVHSEYDATDVYFTSDQKHIVRVRRVQQLRASDPDVKTMIDAAVSFYGQATKYDPVNWYAIYGDAHQATYNVNLATVTQNNNGVGMLIKGYHCDDIGFGLGSGGGPCFRGAKYKVVYDLIYVAGYQTEIENGRNKIKDVQRERATGQKF